MQNKDGAEGFTINSLRAKIDLLESDLAQKCLAVSERDSVISEKGIKITQLTSSLESAKSEIESTKSEIEAARTELELAKFEIEQLKRLIYGAKRERFVPEVDTQQLAIELEPKIEEIEEAVKEGLEDVRATKLRNKPKKKHTGRQPFPSNLPVVEVVIEPDQDTTDMVCIGKEITEELDYIPAILQIIRYIRPKYITKADEGYNQEQVIAELNRPIPKCTAGPSLLSMIFTDKFVFHLPFYRIQKRIVKMGFPLPTSTFESWVKLGAQLLQPLYAVHRLYVFREIYQMIDESPIKVQDKEKQGKCHQGYMWVRYAPLSRAALFEYFKSRSSKGPIDDLSLFKGYIQTDGYSGYTYLAAMQGLVHLSCWAHARRYFEKALKNDQERAGKVLKMIQLLYAIEALARESGMSHLERYALRLEKSLPIINEIGQYIHQEKSNVTPQSPIGKAFHYCANRWVSLQNYLKEGMLEIDSNLVENSIRPLALGRKNYLFAGSHDAAQDIAMFYSFFATCAKNDIDPQKWLTYVIININDTKSSKLKFLLPQFIDKNLLV